MYASMILPVSPSTLQIAFPGRMTFLDPEVDQTNKPILVPLKGSEMDDPTVEEPSAFLSFHSNLVQDLEEDGRGTSGRSVEVTSSQEGYRVRMASFGVNCGVGTQPRSRCKAVVRAYRGPKVLLWCSTKNVLLWPLIATEGWNCCSSALENTGLFAEVQREHVAQGAMGEEPDMPLQK